MAPSESTRSICSPVQPGTKSPKEQLDGRSRQRGGGGLELSSGRLMMRSVYRLKPLPITQQRVSQSDETGKKKKKSKRRRIRTGSEGERGQRQRAAGTQAEAEEEEEEEWVGGRGRCTAS